MKKITLVLSSFVLAFGVLSCEKPVTEDSATTTESATENVGNPADVKADEGTFNVTSLGYGYTDLEKSIDAKTMEIHYSKHYLGYTNKLNKAVKEASLDGKSIEEILTGLDMNNSALRNNGGGYYNHTLYFGIISPNGGGEPTGTLAEEITKDFGSFDELKTKLSEAGGKQFGSGWAWLVVNKDGKLEVGSTPNQDNPLMPGTAISGTPILGIDVWEHAYYLHYQNKRSDYIKAFFDVVDWNIVGENYNKAIAK
ncbi:MAG: superoxide dismutase [Moheibacter sp.]